MKIGIDGRLWSETGVGRYIRALVYQLTRLDEKNTYVLFLREDNNVELSSLNKRWKKIVAPYRWHTVAEQLFMPGIVDREQLDVIHFPYFSVPIMTKTPFIVTMHDLTISHFATGRATTLPLPLYAGKRLAYKFILRTALFKSKYIITVSESVKQELSQKYRLPSAKISVTYESGEMEFGKSKAKRPLTQPYLLYVGNAHPHKNVARLIRVFCSLKKLSNRVKLVCIGRDDYFYKQIKRQIPEESLSSIVFPGEVTNADLVQWYSYALGLVFPSLSEGFGIPGLEAMTMGCPVVVSNIPVFREVYGDAAVYFDPTDDNSIQSTLTKFINNEKLRTRLSTLGYHRAQMFSWEKMARNTLQLYESSAGL